MMTGCDTGKRSRFRTAGLRVWVAMILGLGGWETIAAENLDTARAQMVIEQLAGPGRNITNVQVLRAMAKIPRHEFVPERFRLVAYTDSPLPIGYDQTISQPFIVAFMTERLEPKPNDTILEIGTGSGYQAAVLAELVAKVYTLEIVGELADRASNNLRRLGYTNVSIRTGDGYLGWPEAAPFDGIIVTCAPHRVPQPLVEQLKEGGRMIIPVGSGWGQELVLLHKEQGKLQERAVLPVRFVPMTGRSQWDITGGKVSQKVVPPPAAPLSTNSPPR